MQDEIKIEKAFNALKQVVESMLRDNSWQGRSYRDILKYGMSKASLGAAKQVFGLPRGEKLLIDKTKSKTITLECDSFDYLTLRIEPRKNILGQIRQVQNLTNNISFEDYWALDAEDA